jgi:hypothetical protein
VRNAAARSEALDLFLAEREAAGFRVETRGRFQAVIGRRRSPLLRWVLRERGEQRLVVSVDQDGAVTSASAEPRRW